ncbi:hypothetical protein NUW54_g11571 [Trametes sanguinea]|uniref:Uncharacterized protein n=1 Tax=Trametes sanguinea TaxID=158606 RepID=A0ACC1NC83_9APHY|nr:hypothetical protein NUW54_g11571 [Trametes sanguinea]
MEYRCFQLITSGKHVQSAVLSTHLSNVREFNLFNSEYESRALHAVGAAMVVSGVIDIFAAILVVGLSDWAYGWLALQVTLVAVKVFFSLEPMRRIPIVEAKPLVDGTSLIAQPPNHSQRGSSSSAHSSFDNARLPILIETNPAYSFTDVCVTGNSVLHIPTSIRWRSHTPGVYIGQPYYMVEEGGEKQPIQVSSPSASHASLALALAPLHDMLKSNPTWWLLEIVPTWYKVQQPDGTWKTKWWFHMGRGREIPQDTPPNFHVTVRERMQDPSLKYTPRAKYTLGKEVYVP